jgi:hypothetical protein
MQTEVRVKSQAQTSVAYTNSIVNEKTQGGVYLFPPTEGCAPQLHQRCVIKQPQQSSPDFKGKKGKSEKSTPVISSRGQATVGS